MKALIGLACSALLASTTAMAADSYMSAGIGFTKYDESRIKGEYLSLWSDKGVQWNGSGNWEADYSVILISYEWDL